MKAFLIIFCLFHYCINAQTNLVPNPGFEGKNACPPFAGDMGGGGYLQTWYNPNFGTPEYFHLCTNINLVDYQVPNSDSAFIGLCNYDYLGTNIREYLSVELIDSLGVNKFYWVEFYANFFDYYSNCSSNNLAIHFSDTALHTSILGGRFNVPASLKYFNNEVISDSINWVKISGIYQAHGGERFLTLGNFNSDAETTVGITYMNTITGANQAYYVVDDVSVIPLDSIVGSISIHAGPDQTLYIGDTVFIGEKITNLPANWFKLDGTTVASNTAGLYVWPEETTTYVVTMTLNGFYSTDTVTVFVEGVGIEEEKPIEMLVYPNPNSGIFQLKGDLSFGDKIEIFNSNGKLVFEQIVKEETSKLNIQTKLSPGLYTLKVVCFNQRDLSIQKIVIQ